MFGDRGIGDVHMCEGPVYAEQYIAWRAIWFREGLSYFSKRMENYSTSFPTAWFCNKIIWVLNWPSCSPDPSPIENRWSIIKWKVRQRRSCWTTEIPARMGKHLASKTAVGLSAPKSMQCCFFFREEMMQHAVKRASVTASLEKCCIKYTNEHASFKNTTTLHMLSLCDIWLPNTYFHWVKKLLITFISCDFWLFAWNLTELRTKAQAGFF